MERPGRSRARGASGVAVVTRRAAASLPQSGRRGRPGAGAGAPAWPAARGRPPARSRAPWRTSPGACAERPPGRARPCPPALLPDPVGTWRCPPPTMPAGEPGAPGTPSPVRPSLGPDSLVSPGCSRATAAQWPRVAVNRSPVPCLTPRHPEQTPFRSSVALRRAQASRGTLPHQK